MGCDNKNCCDGSCAAKNEDYLVCTCMGVMRSEIEAAIDDGADSIEKLMELLGVGDGCSGCLDDVMQILEEKKK